MNLHSGEQYCLYRSIYKQAVFNILKSSSGSVNFQQNKTIDMRIDKAGRIVIENLSVHDFLECMTPLYNNGHGVGIWTSLFNQGRKQGEEDYIFVVTPWKGKD
jgi:hypothetical protein